MKKDRIQKRIFMMILGNIILGFGAGILRSANFGVDPYQSAVLGIDTIFKLGYGTTFVIVNIVSLVAMLIFARDMLNIGTFINMFFLGYIMDFAYGITQSITPNPSAFIRIIYFLVSIVLITFASAFIYSADLGISTYDWIALKVGKIQNKVSFKWCRVGTDLICVVIGLIFSIIPGVGTVVTAFLLGPLVSFFRNNVSEPFLYGKREG